MNIYSRALFCLHPRYGICSPPRVTFQRNRGRTLRFSLKRISVEVLALSVCLKMFRGASTAASSAGSWLVDAFSFAVTRLTAGVSF